MRSKLISIVIPVYNEASNIELLIDALDKFLPAGYEYEYLFVNDGSTDNSLEVIHKSKKANSRVNEISFTRNFGHHAAIYAGFDNAKGDAVITMDGDFQDPPEILPHFIKAWERGYNVVYGRRKIRNQDKFLKKYTAKVFYRLMSWSSKVRLPENVGDYRLLDRRVVDLVVKMPHKMRYLRGMIAWLGFDHDFVDYERPGRLSGETKYSFSKMFSLGLDGFISFSKVPLKLGLFLGIISIFMSVLFLGYIAYDSVWNNEVYPLYKWLVVVLFMWTGLLFILIWILGEYVDRLYNQSQNKPLFIIREENEPKRKETAYSDT